MIYLKMNIFSALGMLCMLTGMAAHAENVFFGTVTALNGRAFGVSDERTFSLKEGYQLPHGTEIITEEGSQVSFMDFHNREFHLAGAGHVKVMGQGLKLSRGYLWIRSFQGKQRLTIRTANAIVEVQTGEGVFSFDSSTGKSQLLAVKGQFKFAHFLDVNRYEVLQPGEFSVVTPEEGTPRRATPIGFDSYEKMIVLFRQPNGGPDSGDRIPASIPVVKSQITPQQAKKLGMDLRKLHLKQLHRSRPKGSRKASQQRHPASVQAGGAHNMETPVKTRILGLKSLKMAKNYLLPPGQNKPSEPRRLPAAAPSSKAPSPKLCPCPPTAAAVESVPGVSGQQAYLPPVNPKESTRRGELQAEPIRRRVPASAAPAGEESQWGLKGALRKHLRKTSRHKLEEEGLVEDITDFRQDYKVNY